MQPVKNSAGLHFFSIPSQLCDLFLQMQYPGFDFFRLAYVPEIFSQISTGAAGHVHLGVILVMALGTFPLVVIIDHDLPVIAADHAVVGFGIEFRILDVVVNKLHGSFQGFGVVLHVGGFPHS